MSSSLSNDPSRFWPEDTSRGSEAPGAHTPNESLGDTYRAQLGKPPKQSSAHTHPIIQVTLPTPSTTSGHRFVPHLKRRNANVATLSTKTCASYNPNKQLKEKDDWNIGAMIDHLDEVFKEEMRKDAEGFPLLPPLIPKQSFRPDGYLPEDEDEYGFIRTGARGPRQTPMGTFFFIIFVVIFILFLTLFLTAFMMNVLG